jgi:hypothetical protein
MDIKFIWNGSFVGHTHHLEIDGKVINLGLHPFENPDVVTKKAIEYLKENYNIDMKPEEVKYQWGGRL